MSAGTGASAHNSDARRTNGPLLATGTVVGTDGLPTAGATVLVTATPTGETLGTLEEGEEVEAGAVAVALTDDEGRFDARVDPGVPMGPYLSHNSTANFRITVLSEDGSTSFNFPSRRESTGDWSSVDTVKGGPLRVDLDLGATGNSEVDDLDVDQAVDRTHWGYGACSYTVVANYTPRTVLVGEAYTSSKTSAKFTYTSGASSSLGIGISSSGSYGTYSTNGTMSRSSTSSVSYGTLGPNGRRYFDTYWSYAKYKVTCTGGTYQSVSYEIVPTTYAGGGTTRTPSSTPSATYCVPQGSGTSFTKTTTAAITWSGGVKTGGLIGIDLSSRTGFASTAKLAYGPWTSSGQLCGTHGYPGDTPRRLVGK